MELMWQIKFLDFPQFCAVRINLLALTSVMVFANLIYLEYLCLLLADLDFANIFTLTLFDNSKMIWLLPTYLP